MTKREDFMKKDRMQKYSMFSLSNIAWCELFSNINLKLHDYCLNPKCKCQKQFTFTPN